jgi:hypothetical protein
LRDTSTDPRVHQFFNRITTKDAAWVITQTLTISVSAYSY